MKGNHLERNVGDNLSLSPPSFSPLFFVCGAVGADSAQDSEEDADSLSTDPHSLIFSCLQLTQWAQTSIKVTLSVVVSSTLLLV